MNLLITVFGIGIACGFSAAAPVAAVPLPLEPQAEEVATRLEGMMDTAAQAVSNPKAPNVRMTTCRIQVTGRTQQPNAIFLYQEQALSRELTKPYRQRFLEISASPYSQTVRSRAFKPADPSRWSGWCNRPVADRVVTAEQLGAPICSVFLKRSGEVYIGNTAAAGCPTTVRGAVRVTNHIVLHTSGMETWDRGFDAKGKQVWGAQSESYRFRRLPAMSTDLPEQP